MGELSFKKGRNGIRFRADRSDLIHSALVVLLKIPTLIPETGCGQRPRFEQSKLTSCM